MEKFMLIFHGGIKSDVSPEELQANMGKWMAWVDKLRAEGKDHTKLAVPYFIFSEKNIIGLCSAYSS